MIPSGSPCSAKDPGDERSALLRIGVPRETKPRETRVAATPATVVKLVALGYDVVVEAGAGDLRSFPDEAYAGAGAGDRSSFPGEAYAGAGATVGTADEAWQADVVLRVNAPTDDEIARL